jgi:SET family sugar efflux transporter-like MFS transporter
MPVGSGTAARGSALRLTLRSPFYRGATIAMFLSGLGFSAAAPQIALFLVNGLGASLPTAGMYYLTSLTAPVAGYLVGARSDRTGRRLLLFRLCATAGFLGWAAIAFSTRMWMPFVISAVVLGFSGAAGSQLFAAVHDQLRHDQHGDNEGVVAVVRMALTAGWVVGPVAGSWLAATLGLRAMLFATAVCTLAQVLPVPFAAVPADSSARSAPAPQLPRAGVRAMLPLLAFTGLYVLVYAGEPVKYGFLPIYLHQQLRLAPAVSGAVIGIQPLVELLLMPLSVLVGRRIGAMRLMVLGAAFGLAANLCFATTASAAGMFAGQILMGGVWGVFAALGIIVAQRLLPTAVATASAIFMSSTAVASALGGLTGGLGVSLLGLPHVFFIPAVSALLATTGLAVMARTSTHRTDPRPVSASPI